MIVLKDASYVVRDARRVERDVDVVIEGQRIALIGHAGPERPDWDKIDCRGKAVIPGLVNAHTHLYQSMLKGRRDDLPLVEWCEQVTFPFVRAVLARAWHGDGSEEVGRLWSLLGAMEMIRGGVTCCVDMDISFDNIIEAWCEVGVRAVAAMTMVDRWVPDDLRMPREVTYERTRALVERWHNYPPEAPLVQVALGPSAPFTCSHEMLAWIREQSEVHDLTVSTHVSETLWEVEHSLKECGKPPLAYLEELGLLERPLLAVHGVHLTPEEVELARHRPVTVVHNPKSNMKLGSGVAPIDDLRRAGIAVALGTDGAASNDLLDMFEEMRAAAMLQKVARRDPTVIDARDVFEMATEGGARACRIDAGTLDEGRLADIAIVDLSGPHTFGLTDEIVPMLVYCGRSSDVEDVIVNGRPVLRNRQMVTVDEEVLIHEARRAGREYA